MGMGPTVRPPSKFDTSLRLRMKRNGGRMNQTTSRLATAGNGITDRAQEYSDEVRKTASRARERFSDALDQGTEWASNKTRDVQATSKELLAAASDSVTARPLVAVGIAAAFGYLLAKLLNRD